MQRTSSTTFISFPLAKYSRATDVPPGVTEFTWSHATSDLYIVIDTFRAANNNMGQPSQQLKVVQGTQIMENIPIEELVRQSHQFITTMRHLNTEVKTEQLPVSALVRRPLLALRWNLPEPSNMIRRMQLRFSVNADFDTVFNHLRALGLNMNDTRPSTASTLRPSSSTGFTTSASKTLDNTVRPATSSSSSTAPRISSPLARSQLSSTNIAQLSTEESVTIPQTLKQIEPFVPSFNPIVPPEYFHRPDSSAGASARPSSEGFQTQSAFSFGSEIQVKSPFSSTFGSDTQRPRSQDSLPPRRELPFTRSIPKSSGNDVVNPGTNRARPGSNSSNISMGPPRLPSPPQPIQRSPASLKSSHEVTGLLVPTFTPEASEPSHPASTSSRPSARLPNLPPLPTPTFVDEAAIGGPRKRPCPSSPPSSASRVDRTQTSSSRIPEAESANNLSSTVPASTPSTGTIPQDRVLQDIRNGGNGNTDTDLAAYVAQSHDDRRAALDEFFLSCIDDDSFITLVEDVSVCWSRLALGLR
ncbi:hypothetical protein BU24DRAFT_403938 [Aaosphaeria arxii CBS 175.79]|uniref:Uncharacterized protein n=1 Tax=Aaosphaeria arxii CBS 175.79 TaxID=1450172 RepID=A0A6A5Y6F1_9PLEO|nr:uncharacterized protein BU24DRAFT_403938 [Aaosphaeria arxii CBS 175.79]KAF2020869.1 hypothetical protein BU24DRAFT_403938 [Aaosphaeria arxii CBS 175.79]